MALQYHASQIEVQEEANTRPVADMLASWVGPVAEFCRVADLILLATPDEGGELHFSVVSGTAPLVEAVGPSSIRIADLPRLSDRRVPAGGLTISLSQLRRARINGYLTPGDDGCILETEEAFTNCRKYIAPSLALESGRRVSPQAVEPISWDEPWLAELASKAETAFLASVSPAGLPDVSHRGGQPGFIQLDAASGEVTWPEFIGDGMLKSAGNVRATGRATLLILDLDTGDAAELSGTAGYMTLRTQKQARVDALEQHREAFPVQGEISLKILRARRLRGLVQPRRRLQKAIRITSSSSTDDQAPQ